MIRWLRRFIASILVLAFAHMPASAAAQRIQTITVVGNSLLANGRPWVPRGATVVGLLPPRPSPFPKFAAAAAHWGPAELAALQRFGASVVRFQVSQPGLDPKSPIYTPDYLPRVVHAVRETRALGLAVILSMQWQKASGLRNQPTMPSDATMRAWEALAPAFAGDTGVMYELFNEPFIRVPRRTPIDWQEQWDAWAAAFQPLIDRIRGLGSQNVLIIDGMMTAIIIDGAPPLRDQLSRLAYAVHPYPRGRRNGPEFWDERFGNFAERHPVIVTEWNSMSTYACQPDSPNLVAEFLRYTRERRIGIIGWAFDVPGSLVKDFSFTLTDYNNFRCGQGADNGAGEALKREFLQNSSP